jgi:hypothetical protein
LLSHLLNIQLAVNFNSWKGKNTQSKLAVAEPGQKWDFLIGRGNILLNLGGEGVQLPLLTKIDTVCQTLQVRTPWSGVI